ncbi:hypothetical protein Q5752_001346 [Cryptotrichosporon argae]
MEDVDFGSSFGLGGVLASIGLDAGTVASFVGAEGGASSRQFAEVEAGAGAEAYEDDVSDSELPAETAEDAEERARRQRREDKAKRDEERMVRRAMAMQPLAKRGKGIKKVEEELSVRDKVLRVWPELQPGKPLRMSEVFYETPLERETHAKELASRKRRKVEHREYAIHLGPRPLHTDPSALALTSPDLQLPDHTVPRYLQPIGQYFDRDWIKAARQKRRQAMTRPPPGLDLDPLSAKCQRLDDVDGLSDCADEFVDRGARMLELGDWEQDIVMCALDKKDRTRDSLAPRNDLLETGAWLNDVVWDARRISPELVESDDEEALVPAKTKAEEADRTTKLDPFNLSNDHLYEHTRAARFKIRQTFGAIEVFHSHPAQVLQMPFYKTSLTKAEARAWHRPALQFPAGVSFTFSKLKTNPTIKSSKKKQAWQDPSEAFKTTKDLSMSEKGPFVLLEFSEEYPPIMSGYGMGTTIVNYYRKKDDKDETVPKLDLGQPSILGVGDAEPFLLGYVDPGKVTQVIHNNLIRAPIFKHTPETTDFLVIRQTINGHATYYLREIKNIFVVGQTVPNESEVPGPHARKNTTTSKNRLQIMAWLLMQQNKQKRVKISRLVKYFPDQNELQIRQRLKVKGNEFLIYDKEAGFHSGFWLLNPTYPWPTTREEVLKVVTPESAALFEAMQVGAQHLRDAGYTKTAEGSNEDDGDEASLDIEQQLAVWSTTLNYKKAEANKAWLVVHGEGDPTGRGEGFSFLKTNMKNYFLRRGETEEGRRLEAEAKADGGVVKISNAEQGRIYEEEKRRVWDLQYKALSSTTPPTLTAADEAYPSSAPTPAASSSRFQRHDSRKPFSRAGSMVAHGMYAESPRDEAMSPSAFSGDEGSTYTGNDRGADRVLRITRVVKGKQQVEIIRDQAVIQSYLRRVEDRKLAQFTEQLEHIKPTGNMEEDDLKRQALAREINRLKKNQHRRQQRKKYMAKGELPDVGDNIEGKRRCGACGAYGHTKANRNCPKFNANAINPSPSATPGGLTPAYGYATVDTPGGELAPSPAPNMKIKFALGGAR